MRAIKKAGATTPTKTQNYCQPFYPLYGSKSSIKEQLGELLFYLQTPLGQDRQQQLWRLFESNLRRYYSVLPAHRMSGNGCSRGFSGATQARG
jgi:hypothetical protein